MTRKEWPKDAVISANDPTFAQELANLADEYPDVLSDVPSVTSIHECEIDLTQDTPVRSKPYLVPLAMRMTISEEIEKMKALGAIEPSTSPYSSPIVMVKKKDGDIRFCVDYRKLNQVTRFNAEPLPDFDELIGGLQDKKVLSKIDLSKGYWQIPVKEGDRHKTAFATHQGQFQFKVMPFGLCTSGAVFTQMMHKLLAPLPSGSVRSFIDDILVATNDHREHLLVMRQLLDRLRECSITAKPSKCELGAAEVVYLGHRVGNGQIRPEEDKMEKIKNAPQPTTTKEVKSFLGLAGYYRRFIPHYAEIALPLTDLTKGNKRIIVGEWTEECSESFQTLKKALTQPPVCTLPEIKKPFVLQTDASEAGIGAVLCQEEAGELKMCLCASKKLNKAERNYSIIEKECLAVIWGMAKFDVYLRGREFALQTDHSPLKFLDRVKVDSPRLARWALKLQGYKYSVEAIPGKQNVAADFLSRLRQ